MHGIIPETAVTTNKEKKIMCVSNFDNRILQGQILVNTSSGTNKL